jgi:hypothetical protein
LRSNKILWTYHLVGSLSYWLAVFSIAIDKTWFNFHFLFNKGYSTIYSTKMAIYGLVSGLITLSATVALIYIGYKVLSSNKSSFGKYQNYNRLIKIFCFSSFGLFILSEVLYKHFWSLFPTWLGKMHIWGNIPFLEISILVVLLQLISFVKVNKNSYKAV